jgi:hypothetical protein
MRKALTHKALPVASKTGKRFSDAEKRACAFAKGSHAFEAVA